METEVKNILLTIAEGVSFVDNDIEYCSMCLEVVETGHSGDCPVIVSRNILGEIWDKHKEEIKEIEKRELSNELGERYSTCLFCGEKVKNKNMQNHQNSKECMSRIVE